jgi:squalene-hopene/tetraprenyl-beta-curcumene cyclase
MSREDEDTAVFTRSYIFALSYALAAAVGVLAADEPTNDRVHTAVRRSIPYIQEQGASWIEEKKCVSCHRVSTMVWSLSVARRNGFKVSDKLDEWVKWEADISLSKDDKGTVVGLGNKEGVAQILLSLDSDIEKNGVRKELAALLQEGQQPDGSWKPGGQLPSQKRPESETASVSTMWITLALIKEGGKGLTTAVVERALSFIQQSPAGKSTEWYAVQLLLAAQRDDDALKDHFVNELRKQQQSDGGWGWLVDQKSDALGTGMALYALVRADVLRSDPSIKRAQQFLLGTQREDGSWAVQGTKTNNQDQIQETAVYWGTTWAALGLMVSLPEPPK